jgi:hypothetical protein
VAEPITISPDKLTNRGLDYASLKEEGTALVQQLAGKVWTDYNEHDPGVTTLEQLCYALTELSYRAEFPLKDLLVDKEGGRINPRRQALFIPRRILPCNPLTVNDYRKLFVDRVPQVANVWLIPYRSPVRARAVNGLYDIALYVPGADPCACDNEYQPDVVRQQVRRVYSRYRNLCEDVHSILILKPVRTVVNARAAINETLAPEAILANMFFNLGNFLAPELQRQSLKSMLDMGKTPDEIFNGPLLRNGFIRDDQLQPRRTEITLQEIIRVMVQSKGVNSVSGVSVQVGVRGATLNDEKPIPVSDKEILQLFTGVDAKLGGFTIRLFKNGIEYKPDPARVQRELDKLWADYRRTYKLMLQYEEFFALPAGQHRDVEQYYSIQNQYPNIYGINAFGLPPEASASRRAQARQLKGYLLVFEQLLADFFAQLAHVKDLYSIEYELQQTYFYQYLTESVPNVEPLLKEDYQPGLSRIIRSQDAVALRRNRFLDFLLALYAETPDVFSAYVSGNQEQGDKDSAERLLQAKLEFLHQLVASTRNRGRGFDYLAPPGARNIAGMEIKSRIQLGMRAYDRRPLTDVLDELALNIVEVNAEATVGRTINHHADHIEENFLPLTALAVEREQPDNQYERPVQLTTLLRAQSVTEAFLRAASEIENFRVGSLPGDDAIALVCKSPTESDWYLVGKFADEESAQAAARTLVGLTQTFNSNSQQLYIVEHILLRFGRSRPDDNPPIQERCDARQDDQAHPDDALDRRDFVYSFTMTAIISAPTGTENGEDYRTLVREVIRQNTPSHIVADYCFLRPREMRQFESLYWAWRSALQHRRRREIIFTSARLRSFLRRCQRPPALPVADMKEGA